MRVCPSLENFFLLLRVVISLAAVFGLLFYLRKRILPRFGTPNTNQVNVVERQSIGPKSSVVLLDVQGRRYLLGVGNPRSTCSIALRPPSLPSLTRRPPNPSKGRRSSAPNPLQPPCKSSRVQHLRRRCPTASGRQWILPRRWPDRSFRHKLGAALGLH